MQNSKVSGSTGGWRSRAPVTHDHIFGVIRTLLQDGSLSPPTGRPLRILDIGCGDGRLMDSLMRLAEAEMPERAIEIYGFDIGEQGYRDDHQKNEAEDHLTQCHPRVQWRDRIKIVSDTAPWGYAEGFFDIAVSNQVIEHVRDLDGFLDNMQHSLNRAGASIHLFPLSHCIPEAHCLVPFAHWIADFDYRVGWISLMSKIGIGRFRADRKTLGHDTPAIHAFETAKYIQCWTSYRSFSQISVACSAKNMSISYHFTKDFFFTKARHQLGRQRKKHYGKWTAFGFEWLTFTIGKYLSSSTLIIRPVDYDIGKRIAAEKRAKAPQ